MGADEWARTSPGRQMYSAIHWTMSRGGDGHRKGGREAPLPPFSFLKKKRGPSHRLTMRRASAAENAAPGFAEPSS